MTRHGSSGGPNREARRSEERARRARAKKVARVTLGGVAASSGLGLAAIPSATALDFEVTSLADAGEGSLREAIAYANANPGPDVITFAPDVTGTIVLATGELQVSDDLTIHGPGSSALAVSAQGESRVLRLYHYSSTQIQFTLEGLTLRDGYAEGNGGALVVEQSRTSLTDVVITASESSSSGGGLAAVRSDLVLVDTVVTGNTSQGNGGGVALYAGSLSMHGGALSSNTAGQDRYIEFYGGGGYWQERFGSGGGLYAYDADSIELNGVEVSGNAADEGGGVFLYESDGGATAQIVDSTFVENSSESDGGAIQLYDTDADIIGSTFSGNVAGAGSSRYCYARIGVGCGADGDGGAVFAEYSAVDVTGSTFTGNLATDGGAIDFDGYYDALTIVESRVIENSAARDGGGVNVTDGDLTVTDSTIMSNEADTEGSDCPYPWCADGVGGGLAVNGADSVTITGSTITGNSARDGGGIDLHHTDQASVSGSTISANSATYDGGGVNLYDAVLTVSDTLVSGNDAATGARSFYCYYDNAELYCGVDGAGGGIAAERSTLTIDSTTIDDNDATRGGGISAEGSDVTVGGSTITTNHADETGGGVHTVFSGLAVTSSTLSDNDAGQRGGGLAFGGGRLIYREGLAYDLIPGNSIVGTTVSGNVAMEGGGISVDEESAVLTVDSSTLSGNTALAGGGIGVNSAASIDVVNSTVSGNSAAYAGGGIAVWNATDVDLVHSTVTANVAAYDGAGIDTVDTQAYHAMAVTLDHTIVAGNDATGEPGPAVSSGGADVDGWFEGSHSLIGAVGSATIDDLGGNLLDVDPLLGDLADNGGDTLTHLPGVGSPAIDAGDPAIEGSPEFDQRGAARIANDVIDIGSVETDAVVEEPPPVPEEPKGPLPFNPCTDFSAVHPIRVLDTREGAPLAGGATLTVDVTGVTSSASSGVPDEGVAAVALNVTATNSAAQSFMTVWPSGQPRPATSNLNTDPGVDVANMVIATVGADGRIQLYNNSGSTDVVVDVLGWFGSCGSYRALTPLRALDSRQNGGPLDAGGSRQVPVLGVGGPNGVPTTGVEAVIMNVTSTGATAASYMTVWPTGQERPTVSNLNTEPGSDVSNLVILPPGADGSVTVYNDAGQGHVVVDILGYYTTDSSYVPVSPSRVLDTRIALGAGGIVGAGQSRNVPVAGVGLPVPAGSASVILNVTATQATAESFETAFAAGQPQPPTSNLNTEPGVNVANLTIAQIGADGRVTLYNNTGEVHLIGDVFGYFPNAE